MFVLKRYDDLVVLLGHCLNDIYFAELVQL